MKLNKKYDKFLEEEFDLLGDDHMATSFDTPIRNDAFDILDVFFDAGPVFFAGTKSFCLLFLLIFHV